MQQNWKFQRGDIFFTHFGASTGSEQCGDRPAVILQNDVGNYHSPTLIVATMTSKAEKKVNQPTHCLLENAGLNMPSVVQAEQIFTIDKSRALKYLGHLTPEEMRRVDDAVRISLALNPMGSIQQIEPIRRSTALYAPPEVVDGKPPVYPYTPIKSSFENAGSIEEMMLYTELQSAVHAMIQRLESSENAGGGAEGRLPAGQGKQDPVCPCGAQLQDPEALRCGVPAGQDLTFRRDAPLKIPCAILAKQPRLF